MPEKCQQTGQEIHGDGQKKTERTHKRESGIL